MYISELIDYYIEQYLKEKEHKTDKFIRIGMLAGLCWICHFAKIDLSEETISKIRN